MPKPAAAVATPEPNAGPKVVFLGDSISAGIHLAEDEAFPAVLQRKLTARGVPFRLINAGVSGDTAAGGLRRVDWVLKQKPDVVVIELGANDAMRGIAPDEIEKNLRGIVEKISTAGARALLLGMRIPPSYGPEHSEAFSALYERVARDLDLSFVPFFMNGVAAVPELNLEDGIHPTAEGHVRLAANVEDELLKVLREVD